MQFDDDAHHEYLKTRFFAPAWWVNAFDSMLQSEYAARSWEQMPKLGIGPAFGIQELYLLPLIVSHIQRDLLKLKQAESVISLNPSSIEKEAGIHLSSHKKYLKRLMASLGSVKLYHKSSLGFDVQTLFSFESWKQVGDDMHLVLGTQPMAIEAFTGYISAYKETKRKFEGHVQLKRIIGNDPPLVIWRSLWHEAQGIEQLVHLRMEKAVQWNFNCLNLDGIFGESFQNLFTGISDHTNRGQPYTLTRMVSVIHRLSKKLAEHGSLCKPLEEDYLAFNENEPLVQLLWKVSPNHFGGNEYKAFTNAVFKKFQLDKHFLPDIYDTLTHTAGKNKVNVGDEKHYEKILACQDFLNMPGETEAVEYWTLDNNSLLPLLGLYWEWVARKGGKHPFQVPDELRHTELFNILPDLGADLATHKGHYTSFIKHISEKDLYKEIVLRVPGGCLASTISVGLLDKLSTKSVKKEWEHRPNPGDLVNNEIKTQKKVKLNSKQRSGDPGEYRTKHSPIAANKFETPKRKSQSSDKEDVNEVLNMMKKNSRESYLKLMQLYLDSLDQGARQLILEIKNRMQPQVFEQHIQHRLVRFMLEHPSAWQNLRSS